MSLGLETLNDDQLIELLQEACGELIKRDPVVRKVAQEVVVTEAQRLELVRRELIAAGQTLIDKYVAEIGHESVKYVAGLIKSGEWKPVDDMTELELIAQTTQEEKRRVTAEAVAAKMTAIASGCKTSELWIHIKAGAIKASYTPMNGMPRQTDSHGRFTPAACDTLINAFRGALGLG